MLKNSKKTSFFSGKDLKTPLYKGVLLIGKGWSWFSWENGIYATKRMELIFLGKWNICDKKDGADFNRDELAEQI